MSGPSFAVAQPPKGGQAEAASPVATKASGNTSKVDFQRDIRPMLATHCYPCHGPDANSRKANLRLDQREEAIAAGAIVPGKPEQSELWRRLTAPDPAERMPPLQAKKPPLSPEQLARIRQWLAEGASYAEHWSFRKLVRPEVPQVHLPGWTIRNPIDAFLAYRWQQEGIQPSPQADRITLIRRLSFDLRGLPPGVDEVHAFLNDHSPDAYEKLVDRFLASPHYGERMAVWWLDLVRYADSIGYHSDNPMNVAPYRDYVIAAFNSNKRFDQFTIEQLAGDLLPQRSREQLVASAYNRLLQTTEEGGAQAKEYIAKYAADRVRNYGQVWLGGTLMCAECHNHKYDPYTMVDFYSMAAFFADIQEAAVGPREPGMLVPTAEQERRLQQLQQAERAARQTLQARSAVLPAAALRREREALRQAEAERSAFENTIPRVLVTISGPPRTVRLLRRGNWQDDSGPIMTPRTPAFLPPLPPLPPGQQRYNRLDLARWTVSPDNPLTARVMANRLWKLFYGRGIARSLEESGTQGEWPTHPELLDWLAAEFQSNWDVKHLVRLMVTASAYRQSAQERPDLRERDPLNLLWARQNRFRLDAEFVRDTALAISGLLVPRIGGPPARPYQPPGYWAALNFPPREWVKDKGEQQYRRGLYTHWQRTFPHPAMVAFDAPSREECTCERPRSNIPQQALVLLNDPEFVEAARAFAQKALREGGPDDHQRLSWMFERATARRPDPDEQQVLAQLLQRHRQHYRQHTEAARQLLQVGDHPPLPDVPAAEVAAWTSVGRVLLNLHETITRP
ncbi:MAG: PSD1 and planctomycete cytochrome C domain-containing protein [Gemmataceae bacterium]|nr:PSD1 and planctomycete cytochrome C domain-containing protein [Gemmataceae bacterium]MDW8243696.1 PSD1 and planctomycete cytochrome C domain-containing protein [Thermogemmata sp.]